jgi:hypothetical protein
MAIATATDASKTMPEPPMVSSPASGTCFNTFGVSAMDLLIVLYKEFQIRAGCATTVRVVGYYFLNF